MDVWVSQASDVDAYGEAVWSCPLDAGVNPRVKSPGGRWLTSPTHRGERGVSRKAIVQGMPDCFGVPVVTMLVCFFHFANEAAGAC